MNKKMIAWMLIMVLLFTGCGKKSEQKTDPTSEGTIPTEIGEETEPGTVDSIFDENYTEPENSSMATESAQSAETEAAAGNQETKPTVEVTTPGGPTGTLGTESAVDFNTPNTSGTSNSGGKEPDPTEPKDKETGSANSSGMDYEKFQAMSPVEQQEFYKSFESIEAFFEWYEKVKQEYEAEHPPIEIGGGSVDLGEILGGND